MNRFILTLGVLLFGLSLFAQESTKMSLDEAISYGLQHSSQIIISKNNIEDANQQIIERKSVGLPQLNGEISFNHYLLLPVTILPEEFTKDPATGKPNPNISREVKFGVKNNLTAGVSLSMLAFDGSYLVGLKAARLYRDYVQRELVVKQTEVKNQVIMAYLPALIFDINLQTLDKNISNLTKLHSEVNSTFKEGFAEQLDVDRLDLSLSNLQVERENLIRQKEIAVNYLKFVINYPVDKDLIISDDINTLLKAVPAEDLSNAVNYNSRPEYDVLETTQQLNELNIRQYKAGYLPSAVIFGNYNYSFQGDNFSDAFGSPISVVGAKINVPIFDGFGKKAKIQRARLQLLNVLEQKKIFERSVDLEVSNARKAYLSADQRMKTQKRNLDLAERIYRTTQEKYREGIGSSIEITQAEQSLYTSQQNYNQAIYDVITAKANLDKSLGK